MKKSRGKIERGKEAEERRGKDKGREGN